MIKFLDLYKQYESIKAEIDDAIQSVIKDTAFIGGKYVSRFEANFAQYQQARYCVGAGNGTDALEIAIEALDLPAGSEIIVPANSFIASAEAVSRSGHKIVFCDVDEEDYTLSIDDVRRRITDKTAAVMAVHLYGHPCDMDPLLELAREYDLRIIEDCAQAHGAEYRGRRVGAIGDIGAFSFYPGKNLGAYGDGGAIITNSEELSGKCRMIANHGRIAKYDHEFEGRNSRLDGLQAAILDVKLRHLEDWTEHRIRLADLYLEKLSDVSGIVLPVRRQWARQVYHLFVIRASNRNALMDSLNRLGVSTGIHYPVSLPRLRAFEYLAQGDETMFTNRACNELLSIPMSETIDHEDATRVINALKASSVSMPRVQESP